MGCLIIPVQWIATSDSILRRSCWFITSVLMTNQHIKLIYSSNKHISQRSAAIDQNRYDKAKALTEWYWFYWYDTLSYYKPWISIHCISVKLNMKAMLSYISLSSEHKRTWLCSHHRKILCGPFLREKERRNSIKFLETRHKSSLWKRTVANKGV